MTTWTPEADLAKELGLTRPQITALRHEHLIYGYWRRTKGKGKKILISERGKEKLKAMLETERGDVKCQSDSEPTSSGAATFKPETAPKYPDKLTMTVTKLPMNPYILYAICDGKEYVVKTQSNLVYALRDKLYAVPDQSSPPLYMQIGPKPRWRGDRHYAHYFV